MPRKARTATVPPRPNRIGELREAAELSMDQLGALLRVPTSGSVINKLEKGRMRLTVEWMHRLADALQVHPAELLPGPPLVSREERAIVELYRGLSEPDRRSAYRFIDAMAKSEDEPVKGNG